MRVVGARRERGLRVLLHPAARGHEQREQAEPHPRAEGAEGRAQRVRGWTTRDVMTVRARCPERFTGICLRGTAPASPAWGKAGALYPGPAGRARPRGGVPGARRAGVGQCTRTRARSVCRERSPTRCRESPHDRRRGSPSPKLRRPPVQHFQAHGRPTRATPAAPPRSAGREGPPSWAERVRAMRNLPPFLRMVWETHRGYTRRRSRVLRLLRAFIPLAHALGGEADRRRDRGVARGGGGRTGGGWRCWWGSSSGSWWWGRWRRARARSLESLLGDLFSNRMSVRLMEHAATLDLQHFEDPAFYDRLERARRQTVGRIALLSQLFGLAQDSITLVTLVGHAAGLQSRCSSSCWWRPSSRPSWARRTTPRSATRSSTSGRRSGASSTTTASSRRPTRRRRR